MATPNTIILLIAETLATQDGKLREYLSARRQTVPGGISARRKPPTQFGLDDGPNFFRTGKRPADRERFLNALPLSGLYRHRATELARSLQARGLAIVQAEPARLP